MKKTLKRLAAVGLTGAMFFGGSLTAFAGTWKTGSVPNENKWWYDFDNGTYAADGWQWIDGDNDGIAECYYFDAEGWMLANTTTPDGYQVNADGAWTENGIVQTQRVQEAQTQETQAEQGTSNAAVNENYSGANPRKIGWPVDYVGEIDLDAYWNTHRTEIGQ